MILFLSSTPQENLTHSSALLTLNGLNSDEAADMLLSASRSEGFPYSILEMLSLGKPCVMSDIPGVSWAKKYPLSYVFASENISACKKAIVEAASEKEQVFLSKTAEQIRTDYNIHTWVNRVLNTYEN